MAYEKKEWHTGDIIDADGLNNIEEGISALDVAIGSSSIDGIESDVAQLKDDVQILKDELTTGSVTKENVLLIAENAASENVTITSTGCVAGSGNKYISHSGRNLWPSNQNVTLSSSTSKVSVDLPAGLPAGNYTVLLHYTGERFTQYTLTTSLKKISDGSTSTRDFTATVTSGTRIDSYAIHFSVTAGFICTHIDFGFIFPSGSSRASSIMLVSGNKSIANTVNGYTYELYSGQLYEVSSDNVINHKLILKTGYNCIYGRGSTIGLTYHESSISDLQTKINAVDQIVDTNNSTITVAALSLPDISSKKKVNLSSVSEGISEETDLPYLELADCGGILLFNLKEEDEEFVVDSVTLSIKDLQEIKELVESNSLQTLISISSTLQSLANINGKLQTLATKDFLTSSELSMVRELIGNYDDGGEEPPAEEPIEMPVDPISGDEPGTDEPPVTEEPATGGSGSGNNEEPGVEPPAEEAEEPAVTP